MTIGATFGNALRSTGKHIAGGALKKGTSAYGKANKKVKASGIAKFKALVTKSEHKASDSRKAKRSKQAKQLKRIR